MAGQRIHLRGRGAAVAPHAGRIQRGVVVRRRRALHGRGLAEIVEKYVRKGKLIYIEGKIKTRQYGEENNKKYITEIVADEMTMLGGPRTDNPEPAASTQSTPEMAVTSAPSDDLPF